MKGRERRFAFRGFVALADMLFALGAGMLLLNPIEFTSKVAPPPPDPPSSVAQESPAVPAAAPLRAPADEAAAAREARAREEVQMGQIITELRRVEERLRVLEDGTRRLKAQAAELASSR